MCIQIRVLVDFTQHRYTLFLLWMEQDKVLANILVSHRVGEQTVYTYIHIVLSTEHDAELISLLFKWMM